MRWLSLIVILSGCAAAPAPVEPVELDLEVVQALSCIMLPHGQAPDYCEDR